ncbi:MAG: hypothetical protein GXY83_44100 [Rhodopirellula sp.]|nr:hypothetical protein [Rhodopirellula sp.]
MNKTKPIGAPVILLAGLCTVASPPAFALAAESFESTVSGDHDALPAAYVPPLVSNGSLCMLIDYQGGQSQRSYVNMTPGIWWQGRRYGPGHHDMVPFGHFEQELSVAHEVYKVPTRWAQTLNTQEAVVTCRNDYGDALTVETVVFTHLAHGLLAVKKRIFAKDPQPHSARLAFRYLFTPPGDENRVPRRMICSSAWQEDSQTADFQYQVDGHRPFSGIISVFADKPVTAAVDKQAVSLSAEVGLDAAQPSEVTFFLSFADSIDGKDYLDRAAQLRSRVRQTGFDGMLASHRQQWGEFWNESYVRIPDERLQKVYCTAQYHLRANATPWSFPVAIFPTHWAGKYFGWDEMFCHQALISSNHPDIARRCPEFRFAGLEKALYRAAHYGKPGKFGARYPWESLEDGTEGAPPGFWMDHVFHMSNIAQSCWQQYLYTADAKYLETTGYPVIKQCARFFLANMVYESADGGMFLGKCTDLERLGPARQNPFMTSCGAIYTMEAAAKSAALLKTDHEEAETWKHAATKLRESLPHKDGRYVPYAGCEEESVASLGGLFPYRLFDARNPLQKNAAYWFIEHGKQSGNMYPMGKSMCAWYAGWLAAALAVLEDTREPATLLSSAAEGAGCFGELFEINEPAVSIKPWFSTASGNVVYALNQMLVQSRDDRIHIAPAVPEEWKDYSFKLACHGNLSVEVAVKGGRLARLTLCPGNADLDLKRTVVLRESLLDGVAFGKNIVPSVTEENGQCWLAVRFRGPKELVVASP